MPALAVTSVMGPRIEVAIPLVMGISLFIASLLIFVLVRRGSKFSAFGFSMPQRRYFWSGLLLGLPLAIAVVCLGRLFPSKPPMDFSHLPNWMIGLYFIIAAPIQEEIIFRGLVQTFLQQRWQSTFSATGYSVSAAMVCTAILFSAVHVGAGPAVAIGAMVLALLAGELRRRSGSLAPAVLVHALFNVTDALLPGK